MSTTKRELDATQQLQLTTTLAPTRVIYEEAAEEPPLSAALSVIFRYRLIIILVSVAVTMGYSVWSARYRPKVYTSTALVNIGQYIPPLDGPMATYLRDETKSKTFVNNQIPLLKTFMIASIVLNEEPAIREYLEKGIVSNTTAIETSGGSEPAKAGEPSAKRPDSSSIPVELLEKYLAHISYTTLRDTTIFSISSTARRPDMAALMANAHANALVGLIRQQRLRAAQVNLDFLTNRLRETRARFSEAEKKVNDYLKANPSVLAYNNSDSSTDRAQNLFKLLTSATVDRNEKEAIAREMNSVSGLGGAFRGSNDRTIQQFIELSRLEGEYEYFRRTGANRFFLEQLQRQISVAKSSLRQYQKQTTFDAQVALRTSKSVEDLLRSEIAKAGAQDLEVAKLRAELNILTSQRDSTKALLDQITKRFEDAIVNAENDQKTAIIVDPAVVPTRALGDDMRITILVGLSCGLGLGIVLAFLLDFLKDSVHSMSDLQRIGGVKVLGAIPKFSRSYKKEIAIASARSLSNSAADLAESADSTLPQVSNGAESAYMGTARTREAEAFRTVLATVRFRPTALTPPKVLLVTSGQKGEGKTTLAMNLAIASAEASKRTLIIDIDLRIPKVHEYFMLPRANPGLVNCLTGAIEYQTAITNLGIRNLSVLTAGAKTDTPGILLQSTRMSEMLDLLKDEFDQIIIDSPPVMRVADALMVAPLVDGVIVVARSGATPRSIASSTIVSLNQVGGNVVGTVLNDVSKSSYFGGVEYYLGKGYEY